jgi:TM2 domain-containing membrane protein YozV
LNAEQGSAGNVIAALCSFFYPGLGQLVQGRPIAALVHFLLGTVLWFVLLGWVMHILSALDAAWYSRRSRSP